MNYTEASRKVIVQSVSVTHVTRDSPLFPEFAFKDGDPPAEIWQVFVRVREGMKPETSSMQICLSEEEAVATAASYPVGAEAPNADWRGIKHIGRDFIQKMIDGGGLLFGAGDEDLYLPWKVLCDASVTARNGLHPSQTVLDYLGKKRVGALKTRFKGNWQAAAEFEYCVQEMPTSSAVYLAAASRFHFFVSRNDFAAGYLLRDLEVLVHGVESTATKAIEMRKNAGVAGSKKSAKSREARRAALVSALEQIVQRNPDVVKLGEEPLVRLAVSRSSEENPALWRQGKGQATEYLGEIRRGEAGPEMQTRLISLIGAKAPKRFRR